MPFGFFGLPFPGFRFVGYSVFAAPPFVAFAPPIGFVAGAFDRFIAPGFATFPPFGFI